MRTKKRRPKRTAGQRRYAALSKKVSDVRDILRGLQNGMIGADMNDRQLRQLYIMQKLTESYEKLGVKEP